MSEANAGARRRGRPPRSLAAKAAVSENLDVQVPETSMDRPPMRPPMREEDPRAAAARRAAEIRGHLGSMDEGTDEFYIDPSQIPEGWTYEWKRKTVLGQEDPAYQVHLARTGWEPVPTSKHPEMMPGQGNHPTIERKGMMLMTRPKVISDEARDIELRRAKGQVKAKEEQLAGTPEGGLGHRDHAQVKPKIGKSYEAMPIPKD